ncbi:FkbM family methyltransferase [Streptomyces misionensis]|uniref:FkbM family methyltransferase n=1 Tax=Streptomyces misionensis TaxID=67331 RepID=UPI0033ED070E
MPCAPTRYAPGRLGKPLAARLSDHLKHHPLTAPARTFDGAVFPVVTSDVIQLYLWLFGAWEPHLAAWMCARLTPGETVVDAGAHTGYFTVLTSRLVGPAGRVVAIEPSPAFHRALCANLAANGCGDVRTINAAVSDAPGRMTSTWSEAPTSAAPPPSARAPWKPPSTLTRRRSRSCSPRRSSPPPA